MCSIDNKGPSREIYSCLLESRTCKSKGGHCFHQYSAFRVLRNAFNIKVLLIKYHSFIKYYILVFKVFAIKANQLTVDLAFYEVHFLRAFESTVSQNVTIFTFYLIYQTGLPLSPCLFWWLGFPNWDYIGSVQTAVSALFRSLVIKRLWVTQKLFPSICKGNNKPLCWAC